MSIIAKLSKLNNPESFIQINTIKGFKYIDRAGEILNTYFKNNSAPQFKMGLDGLIIQEPKQKIDQLKVTSEVIWIKFSETDSLDMIIDFSLKEIVNILKILEIQKISRVGWRNYFVYEFQNKEKQNEYIKKFTIIENTTPSTIRLDIATNKDFSANLILQPVKKNDQSGTYGILFDIDIFKNGEINSEDISGLLKKFKEYLVNEESFLGLINSTFK